MIEEFLQLRLDQALATCRQRWALGGGAVLAVGAATLLATVGATSGRGLVTMLLLSVGAAVVAVSASGSHLGAVVVAVVALQWVAFAEQETSIRSVGVAVCLFVFHALTALMAATPHTTEIDPIVLHRWVRRSVVVVAATLAVWAAVRVAERGSTAANEPLTVLGLGVIAVVLVLVRRTYSTWWSATRR